MSLRLATALCLALAVARAREVSRDGSGVPLVSLILAVDTSEPAVGASVGRAIASARAQLYPNLELVVVDDGAIPHSNVVPSGDLTWVRYEHVGGAGAQPWAQRRAASLALGAEAASGAVLVQWDEWDMSSHTRVDTQVASILAGTAGTAPPRS